MPPAGRVTHRDQANVFLNVPFDDRYEPLFVTLVGTLAGRRDALVSCLLDAFVADESVSPSSVRRVTRTLRATAREIKQVHHRESIFHKFTYLALVAAAVELAVTEGLFVQR